MATSDDANKNDQHTEFEVKYRVEPSVLVQFKRIVSVLPDVVDFKYAEGSDHYLVNETGFWRFRTEDWNKDGRKELTKKIKPAGATNNITRTEYNLRLANDTKKETVFESLKHDGYQFNFSIWKGAHIYFSETATIVCYTVVDTTPGVKYNEDSFIEIEVNEDLIGQITPDEAWAIINKYEKALEPLGLTPQKRLKKSLFDMYRRK